MRRTELVGSVSSVISLYSLDCIWSLGVHFSTALTPLLSFQQYDEAGPRLVLVLKKIAVTCGLIVYYHNTTLSVLHLSLCLSTWKSNRTVFLQYSLPWHKPLMQFKTHSESISKPGLLNLQWHAHTTLLFIPLWSHLFIFSLCNVPPYLPPVQIMTGLQTTFPTLPIVR